MAKRAKKADIAQGTRPTPERMNQGRVTRAVIPGDKGVNQMIWRASGRDWLMEQFNRDKLTKDQMAAALDFEVSYAMCAKTDGIRSGIDPETLAIRAIRGASTKPSSGMNDDQLDARAKYHKIKSAVGKAGIMFLEAVVIDGVAPAKMVAKLTGKIQSSDNLTGMAYLRMWLNDVAEVVR
ncbi:hypothetical protein [Thalassospira lohafexi]|uniref:Uncharacterized protein n=1 Tax=Thalassospira lohafexi TaxID=744227 RepID=A0A2N3L0W5_9PROT|nr:hypothetical protein [Thalassospira lohafexi]PKR56360.1 hypothetical protein COO92_21380 [Thalassospira lohafexi]